MSQTEHGLDLSYQVGPNEGVSRPGIELSTEFQWKALSGEAQCPHRQHVGDAGYDLYVSRKAIIDPGQFLDVHTDIAVRFPMGVWGRIVGRSSTLRRRNILVAEGIIDNQYTGELFIGAYNISNEQIIIEEGERIAQLIPCLLVNVKWNQVEDIGESERGSQGFGSTGE